MAKKDKRAEAVEPQIVVNITPLPLDAPAYIIQKDMSDNERRSLRLAWEKAMKEAEVHKPLFVVPESGMKLEELHTEHLRNLYKQIGAILLERREGGEA